MSNALQEITKLINKKNEAAGSQQGRAEWRSARCCQGT